MKDLTKIIVGALIIGVAIIVGFWVSKTTIQQYGASSGPTHTNLEYFYGGIIEGGGKKTFTAGATNTVATAKDICDYDYWEWAGGGHTQSTTTLPTATSTISQCLSKVGDYKEILYFNLAANSASTTVFATTTGTILLIPDDGGNRVVNGRSVAKLTFFIASSSFMYVNVEEWIPSLSQ